MKRIEAWWRAYNAFMERLFYATHPEYQWVKLLGNQIGGEAAGYVQPEPDEPLIIPSENSV